ncbi:hypothetical protein GCM10011339_37680 [Echinicola rosea]|uniref:Uncharacterized protein n=1 Tax=Echinicola rosea TaxID=1807691 RepID=A0ABQ1V9F1_9BACT|nr:hypothetical protein GCM10011339_37680 [Echinicola rosea]
MLANWAWLSEFDENESKIGVVVSFYSLIDDGKLPYFDLG